MGIEPVTVSAATAEYGRILVEGENFTEYSVVFAGEEALDTVYVDVNCLAVELSAADAAELEGEISVAQCTADGKELSRSNGVALEILRASK